MKELCAALVVNRHMTTEPGCVVAAAGEAPGRGDAVPALDFSRLAGAGAPGEDAAGATKNLPRGVGLEIGGRPRAAGPLVGAPRGAGVGLGDFLDDLDSGVGEELGAAQRTRQ